MAGVGDEWLDRLRRHAPLLAVLVVVAFCASDWPFGWSFWFDHPAIAAFLAGLVLLLLTASVVDSYFRRREARRWQKIGRLAGAEFAGLFDNWILAMHRLVGVEDVSGVVPDIQAALRHGERRAQALAWPVTQGDVLVEPYRLPDAIAEQALAKLWQDKTWLSSVKSTHYECLFRFAGVVSRWQTTFVFLDDEQLFAHLAGGAATLDRAVALLDTVDLLEESPGATLADLVQAWLELYRAVWVEVSYWITQWQKGADQPAAWVAEHGVPKA